MKAFFSQRRRYLALGGLIHFWVPRPYRAGAWGPQVNIGLLILWLSFSIGAPGHASELRISWPWRGEPLVMLRWSGSSELWHWGRRHGELWLGRLSMRLLGPRYALGSLLRLFTHGDQ